MSTNWWMDKEDVVYIYNGILLDNEKEWNLAICNNVDRTGGYYAEWNKSVRGWQLSYIFTCMWNLRNLTEDRGGREGEKNFKQREANHKRLLNTENKQLMGGARGREKWVMGIEEGTCWDEHWVLYVSDESWESTLKAKSTLYTLYVS